MRIIVAGSRTIKDYDLVVGVIRDALIVWGVSKSSIELVTGKEPKGVDRLAEMWAETHEVPCHPFPAKWDIYGKAAGPIRNTEMADYADALIAIWDGESKGTRDMINKAQARDLFVYIYKVERRNE